MRWLLQGVPDEFGTLDGDNLKSLNLAEFQGPIH